MFLKAKNDYYNEKFEDEEELPIFGIEDILYSLKRFWWILLVIMSMSGIGGYFYSKTIPYMYESTIKLMFLNKYSFKETGGMSLNIASYVEVAKSNMVLDSVIEKYNLKMSAEVLRSRLSVLPIRGTEFINIKYKDTDAAMTAIVVTEVANQFIERARQIFRTEELSIFEKARNPEKPILIDKFKIIGGFIGAGFFIGALIVAAIEFFTKKLRRAQEIEKFLEIQMLGSIPDFKGK